MVASKTSIIVAAVALGAATAYAAPTTFNKDIALNRREADESTLIAREFDDDELYARESYDDLDARDFDDLETRDFDEDELYARELYEDELYARELYEDELEARELYEDELEARDFEDYENLFARAVEATLSKNSTSTPSSTATSSTSTPSSTSTGTKNDEHLATTPTSTSTPSPTSIAGADEEDHSKHHDICKPYVKAYELLAVQSGHNIHEHDIHEHDLHEHGHLHDSHQHDVHQHNRHPHHRHRHRHRHHLSAKKIAEVCGPKIAALFRLADHEHGKAADATSAHSTESKTLNVQAPTKAKRDLTQLWARVMKVGELPQLDLKTPGPQNPDTAGSSNAQSLVSSGTDGPVTSNLSSGSENPLPASGSDNNKPHGHPPHHRQPGHRGHQRHHHHHWQHHWQHHGHNYPGHRGNHGHRRPHHRGHGGKQKVPSGLDTTKSVTDTAVNSGVVPTNGDATPVPMSSASSEKPQANSSPATPDSGAPGVPAVRRRSLGDDIYWKRSLAGSLGLDLDYFTKRFYGEDGIEY